MGAIRDAANDVFDDYNTSGNPASGVKSPVKSEIRDLFGVVEDNVLPLTADGGLLIDGGTLGSVGAARSDAQIAAISPAGDGKALILLQQDQADGECAVTAYAPNSDDDYVQNYSLFSGFYQEDNTATDLTSYIGIHGSQFAGGSTFDNTPFIAYTNNALRLLGGNTAGLPWDLSDLTADWMHNYQNSHLQGVVVGGLHEQAITNPANLWEIGGSVFFGAVDGSGASTYGVGIGYSSGASSAFISAYHAGSLAAAPVIISGSAITLSGGHVLPDADNSRNLGSGSFRFKELFAGTGTINTSHGPYKTVRGNGSFTAAEKAWGKAIAKLVKPYFWNDAIEKKGDAARLHVGVIAQEIERAGRVAGIQDPFHYGFLCHDPLTRKVVKRVVSGQRQAMEAVETIVHAVEVSGGKAVQRKTKKIVRRPKFMSLPVVDPQGKPVMISVAARDEKGRLLPPVNTGKRDKEGRPIFKSAPKLRVQKMHRVPVMEDVLEDISIDEPQLDAAGNQQWVMGVRYTELIMFLIGTGAVA